MTVPAPGLSTRDRLIVALDFPSAPLALQMVDRLEGRCLWFKVGLELYLNTGRSIVETLCGRGFNVFLDLKLHDIPNTVAGAVRSASSTGASLLTVHAAGGRAMMEEAANAAASLHHPPKILAVTVLTSMDGEQLAGIGVPVTPAEQVLRLALLANASGIDGLVCSPAEASLLCAELPAPLLVVPGIRPEGAARGDQSRIATPSAALASGASMLVVGRPITQAHDPATAVDAILAEMSAAIPQRK